MKKLLAILVLGLMWSGNAYAKDLTGTQLLCDGYKDYTALAIDFKTSTKGYFYEIRNKKFWHIFKDEISYKVTADHIIMDGKEEGYKPSLTRKNLKLNNSFQCEILNLKTKDMDAFMNFVLEDLKKKSEEKNKI